MTEKRRSGGAEGGRVEGPSRRPLGRGWLRRFLGDEHGTASIEAVIMLPFFIIVWGLLLFAVDVYKHKLDAGLRARDCGWSYAQTGCQTVPPQCQEEPGDPVAVDGDDGSGDLASSVDELPLDIPIIGDLLNGIVDTLFGELRRSRHNNQVRRPRVLGETTVQTRGAFAIMCNERPRTVGEMARDMVCAVASFFCS
jgi:hypothetical protein